MVLCSTNNQEQLRLNRHQVEQLSKSTLVTTKLPNLEVDSGIDFQGCREQSNHKVKFHSLGALKCKGTEGFHLKGKSNEL